MIGEKLVLARAELNELDRLITEEKYTADRLERTNNDTHIRVVHKLVSTDLNQADKKKLIDKLAVEDSHVQNLISKIESLHAQLGFMERLKFDAKL